MLINVLDSTTGNYYAGGFVGLIGSASTSTATAQSTDYTIINFINCNTEDNTSNVKILPYSSDVDDQQVSVMAEEATEINELFKSGESVVGGFVGLVNGSYDINISGTQGSEASANGPVSAIDDKLSVIKGTLIGGTVGGYIGRIESSAKFDIHLAKSECNIISNTYKAYVGGFIGLNYAYDYKIYSSETRANISSIFNKEVVLEEDDLKCVTIEFTAGGLIGKSIESDSISITESLYIINEVKSSASINFDFSNYLTMLYNPIVEEELEDDPTSSTQTVENDDEIRVVIDNISAGGLIGYLETNAYNQRQDDVSDQNYNVEYGKIYQSQISNFDLDLIDITLINKRSYAGGVIGYLKNYEQSENDKISYYISNNFNIFELNEDNKFTFTLLTGNVYANFVDKDSLADELLFGNLIEYDYSYAGGIIGYVENTSLKEFNVRMNGLTSYVDVYGFNAGGLVGGSHALYEDNDDTKTLYLNIVSDASNVGAIYVDYYTRTEDPAQNLNYDESEDDTHLFELFGGIRVSDEEYYSEHITLEEENLITIGTTEQLTDIYGSYKGIVKDEILLVQIQAANYLGGAMGYEFIEKYIEDTQISDVEESTDENVENESLDISTFFTDDSYLFWSVLNELYEGFIGGTGSIVIGYDKYVTEDETSNQIIHNGYVEFGGLYKTLQENTFIVNLYQEKLDEEDQISDDVTVQTTEQTTEEGNGTDDAAQMYNLEFGLDINRTTVNKTFKAQYAYMDTDESIKFGNITSDNLEVSQIDTYQTDIEYKTLMKGGQYSIVVGNNKSMFDNSNKACFNNFDRNSEYNGIRIKVRVEEDEVITYVDNTITGYTYFDIGNIDEWKYNPEKNILNELVENLVETSNLYYNDYYNEALTLAQTWINEKVRSVEHDVQLLGESYSLLSLLLQTQTMIYTVPNTNLQIKFDLSEYSSSYIAGVEGGNGAIQNPEFKQYRNNIMAVKSVWDECNASEHPWGSDNKDSQGKYYSKTAKNAFKEYLNFKENTYDLDVTADEEEMVFTALYITAFANVDRGFDAQYSSSHSETTILYDFVSEYDESYDPIYEYDQSPILYYEDVATGVEYWDILATLKHITSNDTDDYWVANRASYVRLIAYINDAYITNGNMKDGNVELNYKTDSSHTFSSEITPDILRPGDIIYNDDENPLMLLYKLVDENEYYFIDNYSVNVDSHSNNDYRVVYKGVYSEEDKCFTIYHDYDNNGNYESDDAFSSVYKYYDKFKYYNGEIFINTYNSTIDLAALTSDASFGPTANIPLQDYINSRNNSENNTRNLTFHEKDANGSNIYYDNLLGLESYKTAWEYALADLSERQGLIPQIHMDGRLQIVYNALSVGSRVKEEYRSPEKVLTVNESQRQMSNGLTPVNCDADGHVLTNSTGAYTRAICDTASIEDHGYKDAGIANWDKLHEQYYKVQDTGHVYNKMIHYAYGVHHYFNIDSDSYFDANTHYGLYNIENPDGPNPYIKSIDSEGNVTTVANDLLPNIWCQYSIQKTIRNVYNARQMYNDCIGFCRMVYGMAGYTAFSQIGYDLFKTYPLDKFANSSGNATGTDEEAESIAASLTPGDIIGDNYNPNRHFVIYLGKDPNFEENHIVYYIDQECYIHPARIIYYPNSTNGGNSKWSIHCADNNCHYGEFVAIELEGINNRRENIKEAIYSNTNDVGLTGLNAMVYDLAETQLSSSDKEVRLQVVKNALTLANFGTGRLDNVYNGSGFELGNKQNISGTNVESFKPGDLLFDSNSSDKNNADYAVVLYYDQRTNTIYYSSNEGQITTCKLKLDLNNNIIGGITYSFGVLHKMSKFDYWYSKA